MSTRSSGRPTAEPEADCLDQTCARNGGAGDAPSVARIVREVRMARSRPTAVLAAAAARMERSEPFISAMCATDWDAASQRAELLDDELKSGGSRSALHGIPIVIKDNIDVFGYVTSAGSRVLAGVEPARTPAPVVRKVMNAGAVIVGKSRLPEFAVGTVTPGTNNPLDLSRIAGGSSGGSAAAVASGMVPLALGTDTGGSIRIPSAACGVVGLKPRTRALPRSGVIPCSLRLDAVGPITRSVADLALVWDAISGVPAPAQARRITIGRVADTALGPMDRAIRTGVDQALDRVATRPDVQLIEVTPPHFESWHPHRRFPLLVDMLAYHQRAGWYPAKRASYTPRLRRFLGAAEATTAAQVMRAQRCLEQLTEALASCLERCDVLALPTLPMFPPTWTAIQAEEIVEQPTVDRELTRFCAPFNFLSVAALSLPCATSASGLSVGLQLVGRTEWDVIHCGLKFEENLSAWTVPVSN